ncbi:MAG TPA: polyprenyl synthetase family protein [Candidatus Aminicenantes bacterium]|nr:polyprenyl synthetase family protein [Candidatus Aminicenantes bacterium]
MTSPTPLLDRWSSAPKWKDLSALYGEIRADLDRVEERLDSWSRSPNPLTAEISRYVLRKKGKRLRPALVLLAARLFSPGSEESVFLASLVELLHTASLIHDDIVDNAGVRRGKASVHAKWGPNITVLLGDYLYIKSIGLSLQSRHARVIRLLADVSARMIEGELDEYALAGDLRVTEEQYRAIIESKTAVLFGACCRIGAILGLASPEEEEAVAAYGLNLGLTFQVVDDLLDLGGDPAVLGKPVLADLAEGRITLPLIRALQTGGRAERERIKALVGRRDVPAPERRALLDALAAGDAFEYARGRAVEYAEKSLEAIEPFPESPTRETLIRLALFGLTRRK